MQTIGAQNLNLLSIMEYQAFDVNLDEINGK